MPPGPSRDLPSSTSRTRRGGLGAALIVAALLGAAVSGASDPEPPMLETSFQQMFAHSRDENRGLVLFVGGQAIPGLVTSYSDEVVEMRSQQYERIVVRVDRIDGMAHQ